MLPLWFCFYQIKAICPWYIACLFAIGICYLLRYFQRAGMKSLFSEEKLQQQQLSIPCLENHSSHFYFKIIFILKKKVYFVKFAIQCLRGPVLFTQFCLSFFFYFLSAPSLKENLYIHFFFRLFHHAVSNMLLV